MAKKASFKVEVDNYFDGMEPPKITELDKLIKVREEAKQQSEAAKEELELAEGRLHLAINKHADSLERDAKGNLRYLCKPMQLIATLDMKEAKAVIKVKHAPKAKAQAAN